MVVITSNQRDVIFDAVRAMYTALATRPETEFHFPTGRRTCEYVGYPVEILDRIASSVLECFAGVGYPFAADTIRPGDVVLDIGSGSGTDLLLAALLVGSEGRAIGLDVTAAMRSKCLANAEQMGLANVEVLEGNAESIPLPDASVDVVTSNGVINLVPDKDKAASEIHRVLRPGGRMQISDIVVRDLPSAACRSEPELWAACVVGATTESDYIQKLESAGLTAVERLSELDYFAASASESTKKVARGFGAYSVTLKGIKPTA